MEILRDPLWQFIGALLALLAITITLIIFFLQRKKKKISYEVSKFPLLSFREELEGKFKIYYEDNIVKNVLSIVIKFYNTGNQPISSNDFERNLSIEFEKKAKILSSSICHTEPENLSAKMNIDNNRIVFDPLLLNPKDCFTVRSLVTESEGKFSLDYRIIGLNKIIEGSPTQTSSFVFLLIGFLFSISGMIWLVVSKSNIDKNPFETTNSTIGFLFFIGGYILLSYGLMINKKIIRKFSIALRKFLSFSKN